ncbi:MAG: hypothetical protein BWY38_03123 [Ignavibacteria bacterium ADurb.Bin266]|nr:MAG: hypothetical protein BWY38_03123 [Ignavibacteria bacterium ADurb.Bin266]
MQKLFNTEFEVSMRLLILVDSIGNLNEDELAYIDFFSIYSRTFNFGNDNLNGDCSFPVNEITIQRKLIKNAIKDLVLKSLIKVSFDNIKGYVYSVTNQGYSYVRKIDDSYSRQYQQNVRLIKSKLSPISILKLKEIATQRSDD